MSSALANEKAKESQLTQAEIRLKYLFEQGVDFKNRTITIDGEIQEGDFLTIDAALSELENGSRAGITIRINSPGGSVYDALAIVGRLKASKCYITTEGYGHIMSAATLILASGDKRFISKYGWCMVHEFSYAPEGKHSSIRDEATQVEREHEQWANLMQQFSRTSASKWLDLIYKKDSYLSPEQCLELGIIDELI